MTRESWDVALGTLGWGAGSQCYRSALGRAVLGRDGGQGWARAGGRAASFRKQCSPARGSGELQHHLKVLASVAGGCIYGTRQV